MSISAVILATVCVGKSAAQAIASLTAGPEIKVPFWRFTDGERSFYILGTEYSTSSKLLPELVRAEMDAASRVYFEADLTRLRRF